MEATETTCLRGKAISSSPREGGQRVQEETGAADRLSGKSDASFATAEASQAPAMATGKLKKTAFKLFGGKRSICTLPSFFGGKNKGQGKGVTKKGLSKSKTHDGISNVGCEEATLEHPKAPPDNRADIASPQLPCSQSLGADASFVQSPPPLSLSSEGFEKKTAREKSLFLPRSKKGLRGFFNSIRRHKKNRSTEPEKTEMQEWAATEEQAGIGEPGDVETFPSSEKVFLECMALPADGGEDVDASPGRAGRPNGMDQTGAKRNSLNGELVNEGSPDIEVATADSDNSANGKLPNLLEPESFENGPSCLPCNDQLDMLFGDVTSLKSFDSFTGCGDIIAEPDIDNVTESSASAERSKEAVKRSSCLVTYQGGGEEMAMPDEVEEYLQQMWEGATKEDESYERKQPEMVVKGEHQGVKGEVGLYGEGKRNEMDLLTPHSDQQESAPNSDEGYYDSVTPGPEDEAGDGLEEVKKDRLPRDSYSGDALYEFYEADDVLVSPSHGEEPWLDKKVGPPEMFARFFDLIAPEDKGLVQGIDQKNKEMETEEERMEAIQKQLLYWEMQREPTLKQLEMFSKEQLLREIQHHDCAAKVSGFMGENLNHLAHEERDPHAKSGGLNLGEMPAQLQDWKGLQPMLLPEGFLTPLLDNGSMLDDDSEQALLELCTRSGLAMEKSGSYPFYRTHSAHGSPTSEQPNRDESGFGESLPENGCELEQAVNFSQALVEFTSSGTLFSSLSESLGSSDSGSAFTQTFPALPTMVTFDIVDVEQDGEGECEQNPEMAADGDFAASFEAFDESYVPKESFAECDERMFPRYAENLFQSCNWGMASLPRCLRLQELAPPGQELLSTCRRSRSLDTESLEFELAGLQLPRNRLKPCESRPQRSSQKKGLGSLPLNVGQASAPCSPEEKHGDGETLSWPGLQNVSYGKEFFSQDMKPWDYDLGTPSFRSPWPLLEELGLDPPSSSLERNSNKLPSGSSCVDGVGSLGDPEVKLMARPSDLPLQTPVMSHEEHASHRPCGNDGGV